MLLEVSRPSVLELNIAGGTLLLSSSHAVSSRKGLW